MTSAGPVVAGDTGDHTRSFADVIGTSGLCDVLPAALVAVDGDGAIVWANRRVVEVLGWEPDDLVGRSVEELVPADLRSDHRVARQHFVRSRSSRSMSPDRRFEALRRDGSTFPAQIALTPLDTARGRVVVAAIHDMSTWVEAERRALVAQRRTVVAEDRDRIARNLHDTVVQELFGLGMTVQSWITSLPDEELRSHLGEAVTSIDRIIREIRATIFGLPTWVESTPGDVVDAIEDIIGSLEPHLGFRPELEVIDRGAEPPSDAVVEHLLPTVREALTNVARHARATRAEIRLDLGERVSLTVSDDGIGLPTELVHTGGLDNLARRASVLGGSMTVKGRRAGGTTITWSVPAHPPPADRAGVSA